MWEARIVGRKEEEPTSAAIPALQEETQCAYNLHKERHTPNMSYTLLKGSNLDLLPTLPDCSIDAIVTDPPYELGFMGKSWDASGIAYSVELWRECLRVLKHGGHLLAFGGSRTYHRLAVAIEDAGFEIRDQIMWVYGSGFPKSLDVSKAINKAAGVEYEAKPASGVGFMNANDDGYNMTLNQLVQKGESTDEAKKWSGWGTALKPAHEPIVVARKPLDGTVANNVLKHGVGGLNIDACRVGTEVRKNNFNDFSNQHGNQFGNGAPIAKLGETEVIGRFPANFIHDGSEEVLALFPDTGKSTKANRINIRQDGDNIIYGHGLGTVSPDNTYDDSGSAARFFYCAKASKAERNAGLEHMEAQRHSDRKRDDGVGGDNPRNRTNEAKQNFHPTVKPLALMRYLIRLVTPPNGTVLDPFAGSGTTLVAAIQEGMNPIGIELTADYWQIIHARCEHATSEPIQQTLT